MIPLWSITNEKVGEIQNERKAKAKEIEKLIKKKIEDMWLEDLENLEIAVTQLWEKEEQER